jgi:hypothetical protein
MELKMISDVLEEAIIEIDEYLNEPIYKELYSGEILEDIQLIKKLMLIIIYDLTLTDARIYLGNWKFLQLEENGWYFIVKEGEDWYKLVPMEGYTNLSAARAIKWDKVLISRKTEKVSGNDLTVTSALTLLSNEEVTEIQKDAENLMGILEEVKSDEVLIEWRIKSMSFKALKKFHSEFTAQYNESFKYPIEYDDFLKVDIQEESASMRFVLTMNNPRIEEIIGVSRFAAEIAKMQNCNYAFVTLDFIADDDPRLDYFD